MKRYSWGVFAVSVLFFCAGCGTMGNNTIAEEIPAEQAQVAATSPTAVSTPVPASSADQQEIEDLIKKYEVKAKKPEAPAKKIAPPFELQDIFYDTYNSADYIGKQPLLLVFWTSGCDYCKTELKVLAGRYPTLVQDGLEVFAIDIGEEIEYVSVFIRGFNPGYKVLADTDTRVSSAYRVSGVPTFVLLDKDGSIVFQDNIFPDDYKNLLKIQ